MTLSNIETWEWFLIGLGTYMSHKFSYRLGKKAERVDGPYRQVTSLFRRYLISDDVVERARCRDYMEMLTKENPNEAELNTLLSLMHHDLRKDYWRE